jgi:hypothetical protein
MPPWSMTDEIREFRRSSELQGVFQSAVRRAGRPFFRRKLGNLGSDRLRAREPGMGRLLGAAHDDAFMVAGATKADLLTDLAAAVDKAIAEGRGIEDFRKDFRAIVAKNGWTGWTGEGSVKGEAWRVGVIYRTNAYTSYAAGRLRAAAGRRLPALGLSPRQQRAAAAGAPELERPGPAARQSLLVDALSAVGLGLQLLRRSARDRRPARRRLGGILGKQPSGRLEQDRSEDRRAGRHRQGLGLCARRDRLRPGQRAGGEDARSGTRRSPSVHGRAAAGARRGAKAAYTRVADHRRRRTPKGKPPVTLLSVQFNIGRSRGRRSRKRSASSTT